MTEKVKKMMLNSVYGVMGKHAPFKKGKEQKTYAFHLGERKVVGNTLIVGSRVYDLGQLGPCPFCYAQDWTIVVSRGYFRIDIEVMTKISTDPGEPEIMCKKCGFGGV